MGVRSKLQDLKRFQTIASVLTKQGFGVLVDKTHLGSHSLHSKPEVRLRKAFEELGGAFVKLGQLLALRPDLIPASYCIELEKLQDKGKPISYAEFKSVLESEYSRPLRTIFSHINTKPLAVGSIAQVHKATLTNGKQVVIKALKPHTIERFEEDSHLLAFLAKRIKKFVPSGIVDPEMVIREFKSYTQKELDFSVELKHCETFEKLDILLQTPKPYPHISTKKVLVLEYIDGISLSAKTFTKWPVKIRNEVAKHIAISILKQVFVEGIFHADPHPGNILVKDKYRLALIDFGIVGTVDTKTKVTLSIVLYSLLYKDLKLLSRALLKLGISQGRVNKDELEHDLKSTLAQYYDASLADIKLSDLFTQSIAVARKHKLSIPEKFVLLGKSIATVESVCHLLNPRFKFVVIAKPFLKNHLPHLISSKFILSQAKEEVLDYGELIINMPKDIKKLVSIKEDDHKSMDKLQSSINKLEKEFVMLQKEIVLGVLGILIILVSLFTNTGTPIIFNLSFTSAVLFSIGCMLLLSLLHIKK